jgi:hypothetical protein
MSVPIKITYDTVRKASLRLNDYTKDPIIADAVRLMRMRKPMHLRRGHPRTYKNSNMTIWISDTIVNADATSKLRRSEYKVTA